MLAADGRVRSRMAELAREVRYVKQRLKRDDADRRPYLVRSLKIELRDRDKPVRQDTVDDVFAKLATEMTTLHAQTQLGMSIPLTGLWSREPMIAGVTTKTLSAIAHA